MKAILPLLFLLTSSSIFAQKSIGFTDSADFKNLIDYRLPDWGYSVFSINTASGGISGRNSEFERRNTSSLFDQEVSSRKDLNVGIGITPNYNFFRQSEDRTLIFQTLLDIRGSLYRNEFNDENVVQSQSIVQESKNNFKRLDHQLSGNGNWYFNNDFFVQSGLIYSSSFGKSVSKNEVDQIQTHNNKTLYRNLQIIPSVGIGFGRIRNITPILRALRLNERYKSLGYSSFNNQEVISASEQFTRYNSYIQTYDRPLKYFWEDLNTGLNKRLDGLDVFDAFYLNDIFDENLGSRYEGYSISISLAYDLRSHLNKNDDRISDLETRSINIERDINIDFSALWYKNLNLNHQLNFTSRWYLVLPINKENPSDWRLNNFTEFSWLWVLADRFMLTNSLFAQYRSLEQKEFDYFNYSDINTYIRSSLTYFIENKLSISGNIHLGYDYRLIKSKELLSPITRRDKSTNWNWGLSASLRYYFNRNLF